MRRTLLPRLADYVFVCMLGGCLMVGQRMLNIDGDLGRHLTLGRYMLESGNIPVRDVLSFTKAGESRPPYEWLAQLAFAASAEFLGLDGVVLLTSAAIAWAFMLCYRDACQRSQLPLISLVLVVWAAMSSSLHWLTRPHVFSFLFLALWMRLLERARLGSTKSAWQLPLLMLFWANTHGGFIFGFLAWTAYAAGWLLDWRRGKAAGSTGCTLLISGLTSFVASLATPDLWRNWTAVLGNTSLYVLARTAETLPADLQHPAYWPFLALLILALGLAIRSRAALVASHTILLLGFAIMALASARSVPLFCLVSAPVLALWAGHTLDGKSALAVLERNLRQVEASLRAVYWPLLAVTIAIGAMAFQVLAHRASLYAFDERRFPVRAADWLEHNPIQGNMLNDLNWGGYLLYRMWPEQRVFIDSQTDFYGERFIRSYTGLIDGFDGWEGQLEAHNITWAVLKPEAALSDHLRLADGWRVAFEDSTVVIFVRREIRSAGSRHPALE